MNTARSIIRRLEEAALSLRNEYWITDRGNLLDASDDSHYHHQDHVIEVICGAVREAAGMEPREEDDATTCRVEVGDYLSDAYPEEDDPFYNRVRPVILRRYGKEMGEDMLDQISGGSTEDGYDFDAREFAIKWWGWIRVAGAEAEMRDFTPAMLERAGAGFSDILEETGHDDYEAFDDVQVRISIWGKPNRIQTTVGALVRGELERDNTPDTDAVRDAGRAAADRLDREAMPSFYQGRTGG